MVVFSQPQREDIELLIAGEHRIERREIAKRLFHHLGAGIDEDPMHSGSDVAKLLWAAGGEQQAEREFALRLLVERADDFAQVIDVVVRGLRACSGFERSVSRPLMTRVSTPTLKNEMNFSCASISLRAAAVDFRRHVEHRTLSQSSVSRPENRHGRDASGVVFSENIWTCRLPTCRWSLCHATGLFTICRSTPVSLRSWSLLSPLFKIEEIAEELEASRSCRAAAGPSELPRWPSRSVAVFSSSASIRDVSAAFSCGLRSKRFHLRRLQREAPVKVDPPEPAVFSRKARRSFDEHLA